MATCIFYEFLLSSKWPRDDKYCHNALVFAPDKTVLQSLKEIVTFDKSKVVPPEYIGVLDANIKVYFLEDSGTTLNTLDGSKYNRNLLGGLYRENPVKSRNYEAVKSSKKWENVGNSYIIPALLLYRYSYI
jgi:hypothetical protein